MRSSLAKVIIQEIEQTVEFIQGDRPAAETGASLSDFDPAKDLFMLGIDFRQIDQQSLRQQTG
jgi:hypothetical protein